MSPARRGTVRALGRRPAQPEAEPTAQSVTREDLSARWIAFQNAKSELWLAHSKAMEAARRAYDQQAADAWNACMEQLDKAFQSYTAAPAAAEVVTGDE